MVGFPPGSVLLQYLTLSWPPVLQRGLVGTRWSESSWGQRWGWFWRGSEGIRCARQELLEFWCGAAPQPGAPIAWMMEGLRRSENY